MRVELSTLLCAIDFSEFSRQVIHCGIDLCRQIDARMIVFHAVPLPGDPFRGAGVFKGMENRRKMSRQAVEKIEALMGPSPPLYKPVVTFGDPVEEVERVADTEGAHLVISASRGLSGIKRILLGTVVERMARTLSRPLLTLRPMKAPKGSPLRQPFYLKQIVVGCDFSPSSEPALVYAVELARRCGATLHLLHTIEAPEDEDMAGFPNTSYAEAQEALQNRLRHRLAGLLPAGALAPECLKAVLVAGIPGEALCGYASRVGADLIAVGVQPHGTLDKVLVGSTTETLLRHAPCPVLAVPRNAMVGIGK